MQQDKQLENAIDKMACGRGSDFSSLFEEFVDLALCPLCNNPNEMQIELWNKAQKDEQYNKAFIEALQAYGDAAMDYHDPLGEMFMMRISHGNHGQFFTPETICDFMAKITEPIGESVCDPTCGSGRLLLSGLNASRHKGFEPWIYGNDLSYTCARMTLLNLLINRARGEVTCGNSLLLDYQNYIFFKIDRVLMPNGIWFSTYWQYRLSDIEEVEAKRNAWKAELLKNGLWVELPRKTADKPQKAATKEEERKEELPVVCNATQLQLELF